LLLIPYLRIPQFFSILFGWKTLLKLVPLIIGSDFEEIGGKRQLILRLSLIRVACGREHIAEGLRVWKGSLWMGFQEIQALFGFAVFEVVT
ncbi:MAG: hypothetical protein ACK56F_16180, partial [bacterium]